VIAQRPLSERRKDPRLENNIPVKICQEDGDIVTETRNISRSGAYCRVDKYIEPMTKLKIHLLLPLKKNNKVVTKKVSCQGVVVRVEETPKKSYFNIAVFFSDITQRDADTIAEYVSLYLEEEKKKVQELGKK